MPLGRRHYAPSHYRVWAAFRGIVYFLVLAVAVPLIPRTTPLGWGAALVVSALLAALGTRWLYAARTGRFSRRMLEALDDDQTMGSV
jgi:hypothetical protein